MSADRFGASDPAFVDAVARRVVEMLREGELPLGGPRLMTVAQVRDEFGVSADWLYANAEALGAIRLGSGPRARLRFDRTTIAELYAQDVLGYSTIQFGLMTAVMTVMSVIGAYSAQNLVGKVGTRRVALAGMTLIGVACVLFTQVSVDGSYLDDLFFGLLIFGPGLGAASPHRLRRSPASPSRSPGWRPASSTARSTWAVRLGSRSSQPSPSPVARTFSRVLAAPPS